MPYPLHQTGKVHDQATSQVFDLTYKNNKGVLISPGDANGTITLRLFSFPGGGENGDTVQIPIAADKKPFIIPIRIKAVTAWTGNNSSLTELL
tara:strand:- start:892 stop:1170 length:279 start_codon:yes stop_codon:yes gene_type:complete